VLANKICVEVLDGDLYGGRVMEFLVVRSVSEDIST
jgi:hypothetical protein